MKEPAQVKICNTCKIEKEISNFSKDKSRNDGLQNDCKDCDKLYRENNKEKISQRKKVYLENNQLHPEYTETPQLWYFKKINNSAKQRNIEFNLTYQELLDSNHCQNCCFCGTELKFTKTLNQASGNQNASLDRIDSSKGYEVGNIQWSCWQCNHLKSTFSQDEFIQLCNNIAHTNPRPYLAC